MADQSLNISVPLRFEIKTAPTGMTEYDTAAISADQQMQLNEFKLNLMKDNYRYLASHPEIQAIVSMIIRRALIRKPRDVPNYICQLFLRPEKEIRREVKKILAEKDFEYNGIPESDYEEWND